MRRAGSGRADVTASSDGEQGFWPSYADMMSSFALILFFLMLLSYIQNLVTGNNLQNTQEVLEETRAQLSITLNQVDEAQENLNKVTLDLDKIQVDLDKANLILSEKQEEINAQQALIDQQGQYLIAANEELVEMRGKMQAVAVMRLSILEQIRDSLVKVMGDSSKVSVGENGNIILNEGVLFDLGSADIKPQSQPMLDQLTKAFVEFMSEGDNAQYVDSIVISGHTDDIGTAETNRNLSTMRANSVLDYILSHDSGKLTPYSQYFCAAGYGLTRPVADNSTEEGRAANRRIEISITLKDESVMEMIEEYLKMELPSTDTESIRTSVGVADSTSENTEKTDKN